MMSFLVGIVIGALIGSLLTFWFHAIGSADRESGAALASRGCLFPNHSPETYCSYCNSRQAPQGITGKK